MEHLSLSDVFQYYKNYQNFTRYVNCKKFQLFIRYQLGKTLVINLRKRKVNALIEKKNYST